ncbi:hypothetical protein [Streptomyces sp. NPDC029526]|uniref:hypothetical protein n=1 Tax=Streptomyces sp. NPDC029526 TaxID=3155728 RepID=UPI0033D14799
MNDTPGWASPGSTPDGQEPSAPGPAGPAPRPGEPERAPGEPGVKWSKEQPPPSQWSTPIGPSGAPGPGQAPPPPQGPGWGGTPPGGPGPGGYGPGGWGGPPPAAKPGIIPLRPLGVGEILDGAVSTMRTYWRTVLGISLTVAVLTEVVAVLLQGFVLDESSVAVLEDESATLDELTSALGDALLTSGVLFVVTLLGTVAATALLTTVTSRAVLGRPVTIGEAWRDARPQVVKLLGLMLLLMLITAAVVTVGALPSLLVSLAGGGGGAVALTVLGLLAAAVVAVWLMVRFSLASAVLMLEKQGVLKALTRSAKLVRGAWWRVFGIQLLAMIIASIVASIIVIPFTAVASAFGEGGVNGFLEGSGGFGWTFLVITGIGSVIGSTITFPITAGVTVLLYVDQRIRREALDLELARAAGLPGQGPDATPGG